MKKTCLVFFLSVLLTSTIAAEPLAKAWIIRENTGSPETMKRLEHPDLAPGQTIEVYLEQPGLIVKWGEGYVTYSYSFLAGNGAEILRSDVFTHKQKISGNNWTFGKVQRITIPKNIPRGEYRIVFNLLDYHSNKTYIGNVTFTVGMSSVPNQPPPGPAQTSSGAPPPQLDYTVRIGTVDLSLISVEKTSNRLTMIFRGINHGDSDQELRLYPYKTIIVSREGETFLYSDYGAITSLVNGVVFPPGVPVRGELYFKPPVTKIDFISHFEMPFYSLDDKVVLRNIPVPWKTER